MPDDQQLEDDPETLRARIAALEADSAGLALDNAMLAAGVDLDSKTGQMFRKAWDGGPDVEKIKTEAAEIQGALKAPPAPPATELGNVDNTTDVEREPGEEGQFAERTALTTGDPGGQADPNPQTEALKQLDERVAAGARIEDAGGLALQALVEAANGGDLRVLANG